MPTESRILSFSKNEVLEALSDYCIGAGRRLPDGGSNRLMLTQDTKVRVALNSAEDKQEINFTEGEVAAALVMHCIKQRIPMPRRAIKSLEVVHETLSLHLRMEP